MYVFFGMQKRSQPGLVKLGHLPQAKSKAKRRFFILGLVLEEETSAMGDEQHPGARQTLSPHPQGDIGVTEDTQCCEGITMHAADAFWFWDAARGRDVYRDPVLVLPMEKLRPPPPTPPVV